MIEYKGGKCENCNLKIEDCHYSVFDFHHLNPKEKDISFRGVKSWHWDRIKAEIDKCKLLCSNCHRMEHASINGWGECKRISGIRKSREVKYCICGIEIELTSIMCIKCNAFSKRKNERPEKSILLNQISELGYVGTGKIYNVSDNSIRKWIKV
jgi:hypothetical protein